MRMIERERKSKEKLETNEAKGAIPEHCIEEKTWKPRVNPGLILSPNLRTPNPGFNPFFI
jgi:hypothetical protein